MPTKSHTKEPLCGWGFLAAAPEPKNPELYSQVAPPNFLNNLGQVT